MAMDEDQEERTSSEVLFTYAKAIIAALLIAWGVRYFLLEAYRIPNSGMSPALVPGDTAFVTKFDFAFRFPGLEGVRIWERTPKRGDLIVFLTGGRSPRETLKRVIGVPGDQISVQRGRLLLNQQDLSSVESGKCGPESLPSVDSAKPRPPHTICVESPLLPDRPPVVLKENEVFVAPDLRSESALLPPTSSQATGGAPDQNAWQRQDQMENAWGVIRTSQVLGRARWIWISITPPQEKPEAGWTSRIRWNRMLRGIESIGD
jgi:signal peptidase I